MTHSTTITMTFDSPEEAAATLALMTGTALADPAEKKAPAKKAPAKKAAAKKDEPPADDGGEDEFPTAEAVQSALQAYSSEHSKEDAIAKLKKAGGVTRLKELSEDKRQAVIDAVS